MSWLKKNAPWLKWILAIAILGALLWLNRDGLKDLSTRQIGWSFFVAAVLIRFLSLCLTFSRWWLLVTGIGLPLKWLDAFRLGMFCEACNIVGPGAAGGDVVKAVWLAKDHRERRASAAATVILDRILGLWALFLSGALASLLPTAVPLGPQMKWAVWFLWAGTAGGLVGIGLMLIPAFTHSRFMHWLTTWRRIGHIVKDLMDSIAFYQGRRHVIALAAFLSLLGHVGYLSSFYLGAVALHGNRPIPNYVDHLVGLPLPEALAAIPLTPGGVGTLEGAVGYFYEQHQLALNPQSTPAELESARANGLLTSLAYRMAAIILGAIGVIFYFAGRKEIQQAAASGTEAPVPASQ
ncbi:MAG: flippase-like domain-containing protein [Planctomycetes bacterium]|nr:flippase-like domain-containing protein [Planctomycetota bacterium]